MTLTPRDLVITLRSIASPPEVYVKVTNVLDNPLWQPTEVADVIEKDVSLTARILKTVNSPFYGLTRTVATISEAVPVVGAADLRNIVLITSVLETFAGIPAEFLSMREFWRRSLRCGVLAEIIAGRLDQRVNPRALFVAGLLHDIGSLVVCLKLPELAREALLHYSPAASRVPLSVECAVLGAEHAAVGYELLSLWNLPELLQEAVGYYPVPERASTHCVAAATVHLANRISYELEMGQRDPIASVPSHASAWELCGLMPNALGGVAEEAQQRFEMALGLFSIS